MYAPTSGEPGKATVDTVEESAGNMKGAPKDLTGLASSEMMDRVTRAGDYGRWTRDFLGGEKY